VDGFCVGIVAKDETFRALLLIFSGRSTRFFPKLHDRFLSNVDVLLTVHLSIILVINQLDAQKLVL